MSGLKKLSARESRTLLEWRLKMVTAELKSARQISLDARDQLLKERKDYLSLSKRIVELHGEIDKLINEIADLKEKSNVSTS